MKKVSLILDNDNSVINFFIGFYKKTFEAYKLAYEVAQKDLNPIHPMRLNLALTYSKFCIEHWNNHEMGVNIARTVSGDIGERE